MHRFRQFWPLYLIYAIEVIVFAIALLAFGIFRIGPLIGGEPLDLETRVLVEEASLQLVLAAPVVIGFLFRFYFVKGLWIIYAWLNAYLSGGAVAIASLDWSELAIVLIHPVVVTAVLLFSAAGRSYFSRVPDDEDFDETEEETRFERPAEALLRRRLHGQDASRPERSPYHHRLMQMSLIGGAMVIWGIILNLWVIGSFGFIVILVCFVMHRKSAGNRKLFLFRGDADPG